MALLIRTDYGLGHLLSHTHLDGWMPNLAVGYQEFLFYGPGQTMLIGVSRIATLGLLSDAGGYKVVALASLALFPLSVAWLARGMGLSHRGAGIAAILSLLVSNPFGVGIHAIFENSLIAQQLAASLVFIVLGGVLRLLDDPRRRWVGVTAVALAALMVTHIISTVILGLLMIVAVPTAALMHRPTREAAGNLLTAGGVGSGLAAFWLLPLVAHRNLHGLVATWGTPPLPDRLHDIWHGTFLFRPHVAEILALASLYALFHLTRRQRWAALALIVPIGYVLLCRFLLHRYPHNDFAIQIENRGIGMVAVIATFPLAQLAADATAQLRTTGRVAGVAVAGLLVLRTIQPWAAVAQQMPEGTSALQATAVELRRIVPSGARWVEVREFPDEQASTGVVHPDFWLAQQSGRWTLNEFNPESSSAPGPTFTAEHLLDRPADEAARDVARLGVVAVVATTPRSSRQLERSSSFQLVWRDGPISILHVSAPAGQPAPSSLVAVPEPATATASLDRATPQHLRISVHTVAKTAATVAVAWSPKWHGRINGHPVSLDRSPDGLITIQLAAGESHLALDYAPDVWDLIGLILSLLTATEVIAAVRRARRQRRPLSGRSPLGTV